MNSNSLTTILFIILLFIVLILIVIVDFRVCRDERQYKCYCSMIFKRKANDFGCLGENFKDTKAPECLKCKYYKNYKKHLEEVFK